jgi:endonuclease YncB( thermonuclease family)
MQKGRIARWQVSLLHLLWLTLCGSTTFAATFTGPVVSVLDGDTLEVLHKYTPNASALAHRLLEKV